MKQVFFLLSVIIVMTSCNNNAKKTLNVENPLLKEWETPFGAPPFAEIKFEHYVPAIEEAIKINQKEIDSIINNQDKPNFENTIAAMDKCGEQLSRITSVFYNLNSSLSSPEMQEIAKNIAPKLSAHSDDISQNKLLFARVKEVYDNKDKFDLTQEQQQLLTETYKGFIRGGVGLDSANQSRFREINQKLAVLTLSFGENVLAENNEYKLIIDKKEDLVGLPESVIEQGAETAKATGNDGKWVYTLQNASITPFLQYSANRELRKNIYNAYITKGNHDNKFDNKNIVKEVTELRIEKANILGYPTFAAYILEENMAKKADNVYKLLNQIWAPAIKKAKSELAEMQSISNKEGNDFKLEAYDWSYYANKLKKAKYDLEEEALKPYFALENVKNGVFLVAEKLYGLKFIKRDDVPIYHNEVVVYEVREANDDVIGLLFMDFFPRESKKPGAWMSSFRKQSVKNGEKVYPLITLTTNFTKPTSTAPSLLTFDEVTTLFHEFGHCLHGLLSNCTYKSLSGTSVSRDFVELPSQVLENWASYPEVLKLYAKHYKTNEVIPDELINKIEKSGHFNQGFATTEYLAASILDMDYHTMKKYTDFDVNQFEKEQMNKIGLIKEIAPRYRSTYFNHIFSGGYASGYYSYIWAEVLDADAFEAFKEKGIFDSNTAAAFRKNVLEKGGTDDPMKLYKNFRGKEPNIKPLLERRGLLN